MNIQTFIGCESSFEEASTVLFGIPFDGTTSFRPGTRFAMQAIRQDSFGLESYSPYLDRDLEEEAIHDVLDAVQLRDAVFLPHQHPRGACRNGAEDHVHCWVRLLAQLVGSNSVQARG